MDQDKPKEPSEVLESIQRSVDLTAVEEALNDNQIEFTYNDVKYRVRKPTFAEKQSAFQRRIKKYTELLKDSSYLLEADLRKMYRERGTDIDEMDKRMRNLERRVEDMKLKLGQALSEKAADNELQIYKTEIQDLVNEQATISIEKTNLLQYSIETNVALDVYAFLASLISERLNEDKWVRAFPSFDEFQQCDGDLCNKLIFYTTLLVRHEMGIN